MLVECISPRPHCKRQTRTENELCLFSHPCLLILCGGTCALRSQECPSSHVAQRLPGMVESSCVDSTAVSVPVILVEQHRAVSWA